MLSTQKMLSIFSAAGLSFAMAACGGGSGFQATCTTAGECMHISGSYSFADEGAVAEEAADSTAAGLICGELGIVGEVAVDASECPDINGSEAAAIATCTGIEVDIDITTFEAGGSAEVLVYDGSGFDATACEDIGGTWADL